MVSRIQHECIGRIEGELLQDGHSGRVDNQIAVGVVGNDGSVTHPTEQRSECDSVLDAVLRCQLIPSS